MLKNNTNSGRILTLKGVLRVVSGKYRGKPLFSPGSNDVRPTSGRVKQALFNIVRPTIVGGRFLDLFCGSGQMGIEALSCGAKEAVFVDLNTALAEKNISECECGLSSRIIKGSFEHAVSLLTNEKFDVIFADPPYNGGFYEKIFELTIPLLSERGVLVLEHGTEIDVPVDCRIKQYVYGSRSISIYGGKNENLGLSRQL